MNLDNFRIKHSKIIEQYQLIEYHLEGIFGLIGDGNFEELTHRVENDTMGELIRKVRFILKEKKLNYISKEDYSILEKIRDSRNYWCHQNYLDFRKEGNDHQKEFDKLDNDLICVKNMNNHLRQIFKQIAFK